MLEPRQRLGCAALRAELLTGHGAYWEWTVLLDAGWQPGVAPTWA
jgi:hypothetical protein